MTNKLWEGFNQVDLEKDSAFYIQYLDTIRSLGDTQIYKQESFQKLGLKKGDAVLDIGCGVGHDAECLAKIVGTEGKVAGIDPSAQLLAEASKRATAKKISIEYQQADVYAIPYEDASFAACRADRVFLYLANPGLAIKEMCRVLKPNGILYVRDPDMDTYLIHVPELNKNSSRAFVRFFSDSFANGVVGRQLKSLLHQAGIKDIHYEPKTLVLNSFKEADAMFAIARTVDLMKTKNVLSTQDLETWQQLLVDTSQKGDFTFSLTFFATFGRR